MMMIFVVMKVTLQFFMCWCEHVDSSTDWKQTNVSIQFSFYSTFGNDVELNLETENWGQVSVLNHLEVI